MKRVFVLSTVTFLLFAFGAAAATLTVKCPSIIALKATKQYASSKNKYVCFGSTANAKRAGYKDANLKRKWYPVTTFSGTVDQATDIFVTNASRWRVTWNHPGGSQFSIVAYDAVKNEYKKLLVNTIGATSATSNYYGGGQFYLDVSSDGEWTAAIEEYK